MGVNFKRKELENKMKSYVTIDDCVSGQETVKSKGIEYLPQPDPDDTSSENYNRYESYLQRAIFYNVTGRTLGGLVGQVYSRNPVIEVPAQLQAVIDDANGENVPLVQHSKRSTEAVLKHGRCGLFVDYPITTGVLTKADLEQNETIRPTISFYKAIDIWNWNTKLRGAKKITSLVVLHELIPNQTDDFTIEYIEQWRVLRLGQSKENLIPGIVFGDDIYTIEVWRSNEGKTGIYESFQPVDAKGNYFTEIPFYFIGSKNNDSEVDEPPMIDIANLNIGHYRNSADYEESSFQTGQPTPVFSGLTEEWVSTVLKDGVKLGARGGVLLPEGGGAMLLQQSPNMTPKEAMEHKERQMVALGAKLVEQKTVQRTATEAGIDSAYENSILTSCARNVSAAYTEALYKCGEFVGIDSAEIKFELNTDYDFAHMSLAECQQIVSMWNASALSFTEMRDNLRRADVATLADLEAQTEIDAETEKNIEIENKRIKTNSFNNA